MNRTPPFGQPPFEHETLAGYTYVCPVGGDSDTYFFASDFEGKNALFFRECIGCDSQYEIKYTVESVRICQPGENDDRRMVPKSHKYR